MLKLIIHYVGVMRPARKSKNVPLKTTVQDTRASLREVLVEEPTRWIDQIRQKSKNLPLTNFELGQRFMAQGQWFDAMLRFRITLFLQKDYPQAWYCLGCCYYRMGKMEKAKEALRKAYAETPGNPHVIMMMAIVDPAALPPEKRPMRVPAPMVVDYFASQAEHYDIDEAQRRYQAGQAVFEFAKGKVAALSPTVLDLCCGTGIVSRPWREMAKEIIGVDLSRDMLSRADKATHGGKKLFDALAEADVTQLPETIPAGCADVVLLVNAAGFIGELSGVMKNVHRVMAPDGVFVLTVDPAKNKDGMEISPDSGRFSHGAGYVAKVANAAGLQVVQEGALALYADVPAHAFLLSKRA